MITVTAINSIDDPRISAYRSLKVRPPGKEGLFIVESKPAVNALMESGLRIESCLTTQKTYDEFCLRMPRLDDRAISFYIMDKKSIEDVIGFRFHHGIMMAAHLPEKASAEETSGSWRSPHLLVALNGIHDPQNVGLIVRNAAAFGADALIVDPGTHEPFYRKVARISMGSVFNIPVSYEEDLADALKGVKEKYGTRIVVPSPVTSERDINETDLSGNICIVLGNEASGASADMMDIADVKVRIPLCFERADSLNVACASAVFLHRASLSRF